jgi:hypothetical protein
MLARLFPEPFRIWRVTLVLGYCNFQYRRNATKHYSAWGRFAFSGLFWFRDRSNSGQNLIETAPGLRSPRPF